MDGNTFDESTNETKMNEIHGTNDGENTPVANTNVARHSPTYLVNHSQQRSSQTPERKTPENNPRTPSEHAAMPTLENNINEEEGNTDLCNAATSSMCHKKQPNVCDGERGQPDDTNKSEKALPAAVKAASDTTHTNANDTTPTKQGSKANNSPTASAKQNSTGSKSIVLLNSSIRFHTGSHYA